MVSCIRTPPTPGQLSPRSAPIPRGSAEGDLLQDGKGVKYFRRACCPSESPGYPLVWQQTESS